MLSAAKKTEFAALFIQFVQEYLSQPQGVAHLKQYELDRVQGQKNFAEIQKDTLGEHPPTDKVLQKLLPHTKTVPHEKSGVWISLAPAITGDIKGWFEAVGWTHPDDWPNIACAIYTFVQKSTENPSTLAASCQEFASLPYTRGFQTGMLTPILNALRPDEYIIINNKSRKGINFFSEKSFKQRLVDYPAVNAAGRQLIAELKGIMLTESKIDAQPGDLFDMFCHWLVALKNDSPLYGGPKAFTRLKAKSSLRFLMMKSRMFSLQLKSRNSPTNPTKFKLRLH